MENSFLNSTEILGKLETSFKRLETYIEKQRNLCKCGKGEICIHIKRVLSRMKTYKQGGIGV